MPSTKLAVPAPVKVPAKAPVKAPVKAPPMPETAAAVVAAAPTPAKEASCHPEAGAADIFAPKGLIGAGLAPMAEKATRPRVTPPGARPSAQSKTSRDSVDGSEDSAVDGVENASEHASAPTLIASSSAVILENDLDRERWGWLQSASSAQDIDSALKRLGNKRPYVKNIATELGLKLPAHLVGPSATTSVATSATPGTSGKSAHPAADRDRKVPSKASTPLAAPPAKRPDARPGMGSGARTESSSPDETVHAGFRIPRKLWLALKEHALHNRMTLQDVLNEAAHDYLHRNARGRN